MRSGLFTEIKNNPLALAGVILFHLVLIVLLSINLASDEKPPVPASQNHKIIDAVAVDASKYDERKKQQKLAAQRKIEAKKAAQKAAEKKRLQEKKKKQELERKKSAEKKRQAEKKKQQAAEKQKALALAKKKEADRKAKEKKLREKKAREKQAREKKERELKEKQRLEAEKKRRQEEERQRRAEEKAEFERSIIEEERRVAEEKAQAARAARLQTMRQQYIMLITQKVEKNWLRPASTSDNQSCEIIVTQTMMGDVIDVMLQACTSDNAFQRSVERAVRKASPLPLPPDPELFDRNIYFKFKPR